MALNNEFKVKNNLNTLGQILSSGVDILDIFAPSNTTWTLSAVNANFGISGAETLTLLGANGISVTADASTESVTFSGINATTSSRGVASFTSNDFAVSNGEVSIKTGGVSNTQLETASTSNIANNVVIRGSNGEFSSGSITATGNLSASQTVTGNIVDAKTGFRVNNGATAGHVLRGNGTNFVSSTLAASDIASGQALTKTDDTNVTLTLGGTPSTALLQPVGLTLGWSGQLAVTRGGTGASTAQGAINTLAGATTSGQYLRGNGTNVVMSAIQVGDVPTLNQNTTGSAATLTTTRTLWGQDFNGSQNVTGTLTNVGNIIGTNAITISAAHNQDITLQTTGTGEVNIPKVDIDGGTIDGTTIGLTTPASAVFTGVTVAGNVNIDGNLFVTGSATQINTTDLVVRDPIIFLAEGNLSDSVDIGFTAAYDHGLTPPRHTGFVRNNITKEWTLFSNLSVEILSAVQIPLDDSSIQIDTLNANIKGTLTGNVSGTAAQAVKLVNGRTISTTGDIAYTSGAFDGTANVTGTATINNDAVTTVKILNNNVTYAKIQQVGGNKILGNPTGSTANVSEIDCTTAGRALLSAADATTQRNTLGVGPAQSVTFGDVTVDNGTKSVLSRAYHNTVTSGNTLTVQTFANASYNSAKFTVQIKDTTSSERCALEIIATKNNTTWEGTVYGIVDSAELFTNVDIGVTGSNTHLEFTFNGVSNYSVTVFAQAISD